MAESERPNPLATRFDAIVRLYYEDGRAPDVLFIRKSAILALESHFNRGFDANRSGDMLWLAYRATHNGKIPRDVDVLSEWADHVNVELVADDDEIDALIAEHMGESNGSRGRTSGPKVVKTAQDPPE